MRISLAKDIGPFLTRAQPAASLCARILKSATRETVVLDFTEVVQMSPSFANTLFFNLLQRMNVDALRNQVRIENAAPYVLDAINEAIARKLDRRASLSSYLEPA